MKGSPVRVRASALADLQGKSAWVDIFGGPAFGNTFLQMRVPTLPVEGWAFAGLLGASGSKRLLGTGEWLFRQSGKDPSASGFDRLAEDATASRCVRIGLIIDCWSDIGKGERTETLLGCLAMDFKRRTAGPHGAGRRSLVSVRARYRITLTSIDRLRRLPRGAPMDRVALRGWRSP
jgi:hypothetical protein